MSPINLSSHSTAASAKSCFFPGFSTFRLCVSIRLTIKITAIIIQVTTTASDTPIPNMVKTFLQFSFSTMTNYGNDTATTR